MKASVKCATLLFVVLVAFIFLVGCQSEGDEEMRQKTIEQEALEYLEDRYSADFNILNAEEKTSGPGPIPSFKTKPTYWVLLAESSQFPGETFTLIRAVSGAWQDNYYSLLLNQEAITTVNELIKGKITVEYIIQIGWTVEGWPEGVNEESSFLEWIDAGGWIPIIRIYFHRSVPDSVVCEQLSNDIHRNFPDTGPVNFYGVTDEGYKYICSQNISSLGIPHEHYKEWVLEKLSYED